jgi:hypothetical protein
MVAMSRLEMLTDLEAVYRKSPRLFEGIVDGKALHEYMNELCAVIIDSVTEEVSGRNSP